MNLQQYNTLCEDFSKKSALMNEYLEASTEERKKNDELQNFEARGPNGLAKIGRLD